MTLSKFRSTVKKFSFQHIDVAELATHFVDAARLWFEDVNGKILDRDPRGEGNQSLMGAIF